ncbi:helix-turn-helix domain-containing protein [Kitasatospora sp. NPDC048540]|uniref:TetR/AcrR family transcriptional regulator n=1 Tax=unclassified Kitasatospora TaxID=2633591 RepID=UPI0013150320|nr:TetR family transcriptional regulator [Kitasatospora sp. MBT63]
MAADREVVRRPPGRRAQLLAAAAGQFHRGGYHGVSMAQVAAEAGITAPALYRHFANKPELLRCALEAELAALGEAVRRGADGPAALCAELAAAAVDHRAFGTLWQREARLLPAGQQAALRRELRGRVGEMARIVGGPAAADAEFRCWSLLSVYGSLSHHTFAPPRRRFEELLRELGAAVLGAGPVPGGAVAGTGPADGGPAGSRREALLVAAVRLFDLRGFDNVSTDQLGAAVGIAGPSVYKHFATKAELLAAALVRSRERLWHEVGGALAGRGDARSALAAGLAAYLDFARGHRHYLGAMTSETERLAPADRKAALDFRRDFLRTWVELLGQVRPQDDRAQARIRVHAMFALVNDGVRHRAGGVEPAPGLDALSRAVLGLD